MSPITRLIFVDAYRTYESSSKQVIEALQRHGVAVNVDGGITRFEYEDGERFHVVMASGDDDALIYISMAAHVDGDENGWDAACHEREMKRLDLQKGWMDSIGIVESDEPPLRISNSFHPKDQPSTITVARWTTSRSWQSATRRVV